MFTSLVGWSHVDNLHRIFIPHCWINTGQTPKGYSIMLKVWVAFLVLCIFFFFFLCCFIWDYVWDQGITIWVLGDLYWWSNSVETTKTSEQMTFFFFFTCLIFVEIIFTFQQPRLVDLPRTNMDYVWIVQFNEECWKLWLESCAILTIGDKLPHACGLPPPFLNVEL